MWLASYTVGPQLYQVTRLPRMGTNGTLERERLFHTWSWGDGTIGSGAVQVTGALELCSAAVDILCTRVRKSRSTCFAENGCHPVAIKQN